MFLIKLVPSRPERNSTGKKDDDNPGCRLIHTPSAYGVIRVHSCQTDYLIASCILSKIWTDVFFSSDSAVGSCRCGGGIKGQHS